jgi:hypothetical protein
LRRRQFGVLPDELLANVAVSLVDDVYKAACASNRWDAGLGAYLDAAIGTASAIVAERGLTIQYTVDNAWENMQKPLELFDMWFGAAGLVYICPQALVLKLISADPEARDQAAEDLVSKYEDEARYLADQVVAECQADQRHFVHLDTDYRDDAFSAAFEKIEAPGFLTIFRNEAPQASSTVSVWYPSE